MKAKATSICILLCLFSFSESHAQLSYQSGITLGGSVIHLLEAPHDPGINSSIINYHLGGGGSIGWFKKYDCGNHFELGSEFAISLQEVGYTIPTGGIQHDTLGDTIVTLSNKGAHSDTYEHLYLSATLSFEIYPFAEKRFYFLLGAKPGLRTITGSKRNTYFNYYVYGVSNSDTFTLSAATVNYDDPIREPQFNMNAIAGIGYESQSKSWRIECNYLRRFTRYGWRDDYYSFFTSDGIEVRIGFAL